MGQPTVSYLAKGMLMEWCDGDASAAQAQWHMANSVRDGMRHPAVVRIGAVAAGQHAHSGLMELLEDKVGLMSLQTVISEPDMVDRLGLCNHLFNSLHLHYIQWGVGVAVNVGAGVV